MRILTEVLLFLLFFAFDAYIDLNFIQENMQHKAKSSSNIKPHSSINRKISSQGASFAIKAKRFIISCYGIDAQSLFRSKQLKGNPHLTHLNNINSTKRPISLIKAQHHNNVLDQPVVDKKQMILRRQKQKVEGLKRKSQAQSQRKIKAKQAQTDNKKEQYNKNRKQIQQELSMEIGLKETNRKRQKTDHSLIFDDHKDTFKMMRKSLLVKSKSERSFANESLKETLFNHKFEQKKRKMEKERERYEIQWKKSFLKGKSQPKQVCPMTQFYLTLKQTSVQIKRQLKSVKPAADQFRIKRSASTKTYYKSHKDLKITPLSTKTAPQRKKAIQQEHGSSANKKEQIFHTGIIIKNEEEIVVPNANPQQGH